MICAALHQARRYRDLHPGFAAAFDWCTSHSHDLEPGRHCLDDDRLIVNVESGLTCATSEKRLESHRRYIDIHVNLLGGELIEWCPTKDLMITEDFQPDGDICFYLQPPVPLTQLIVPAGHFAVFYPDDAHKPGCGAVPGSQYSKLVFKVENLLWRA